MPPRHIYFEIQGGPIEIVELRFLWVAPVPPTLPGDVQPYSVYLYTVPLNVCIFDLLSEAFISEKNGL